MKLVVPLCLLLANSVTVVESRRSLQEVQAACSAPLEEALLNVTSGEGTMRNSTGDPIPLSSIRLSFFERCMDAVPVNATNMLLHIKFMNDYFKRYQ